MKKLYALFLIALTTLLVSPLGGAKAAWSTNWVPNPSVEDIDPATNQPVDWLNNKWGNNTAQFIVNNTGQEGSKSLTVKVTTYRNGDAKWYFKPMQANPNTSYTFSDFYTATATTRTVVRFTNTAGQFTYIDLGTNPATSTWKESTKKFTTPADVSEVTVFHLIKRVGSLTTDNFTLTEDITPPPPAGDTTKPTVSITAPADGSSVSGNITIQANASDNVAVGKVEGLIGTTSLGSDPSSPYEFALDTAKFTNGTYTLSATATDTSNNSATATIQIAINNQIPPAPITNGVPNNSVEQISTDPNLPLSWHTGKWGTNTAQFSYLTTGHTGSRSVKTQITSYSSGDAKWYYDPQPVTAGKTYQFSDYYQSNIPSYIVVAFTNSTGTTTYLDMKDAGASAAWSKYSDVVTAPQGVTQATIYHLIAGIGFLIADDYSFVETTPVPNSFNRALVSINFDDGYTTDYQNALPLLDKYDIKATHYIISGYIGTPNYMNQTQIAALKADGNEIGSHTVDHQDLTTLSLNDLVGELLNSKNTLTSLFGTINNFSLPYGSYNDQVIAQVKNYYRSARTSDTGYNTLANFNPYQIRIQYLTVDTAPATVKSWVDQAIKDKSWLVILYHGIDTSGSLYTTTPANLDTELGYIKSTGVATTTMNQALDELIPQVK